MISFIDSFDKKHRHACNLCYNGINQTLFFYDIVLFNSMFHLTMQVSIGG